MSRFVRWLDRHIYVDRLWPGWPERPALAPMSVGQWVRYLAVLAFLALLYVFAIDVLDLGFLLLALLCVVAGGLYPVLLPKQATDGSGWAMPWLTFGTFTASGFMWHTYGRVLLAHLWWR